jgi:transcriptional regulator with XRE-family HTH domain
MNHDVIIPSQVRAARAMLGWSQEQLAQDAEVGLSTVREFESERRAADTGAVASLRRALWNGGVVFTPGTPDAGPGVRLVADRPNVIRRPTTVQRWEGMPFGVEWRGKAITVFVAIEVMDDLGRFTGNTPDEAYLQTFDRHRGQILDGIAIAARDPANYDQYGRLYLRQKDLDAAQGGQWYFVILDRAEDVRDMEARALMNEFATAFIRSGIPPNVEAYHRIRDDGAHIYYFSPAAAEMAKDILAKFRAAPCPTAPNLDGARKARI